MVHVLLATFDADYYSFFCKKKKKKEEERKEEPDLPGQVCYLILKVRGSLCDCRAYCLSPQIEQWQDGIEFLQTVTKQPCNNFYIRYSWPTKIQWRFAII